VVNSNTGKVENESANNPGPPAYLAYANDTIAKAIVTYRNANGPFATIFDLMKVPNLATEGGTLSANPVDNDGMLPVMPPTTPPAATPAAPVAVYPAGNGTATGVVGDYTHDFLVLNRVSNLITTRSDSFTVYVVVEGWDQTQTPAQLIVTRRLAFVVDRSGVTSTNKAVKTISIPTQ